MTFSSKTVCAPTGGYLGAGVGLRRIHWQQLHTGEVPPVLEIVPDHFFSAPDKLSQVGQRTSLVFHDVGLSLGSNCPLDTCALDRLTKIEELMAIAPPLLFSDHLAATRSSTGLELGHLCPVQYTASSLSRLADKVFQVQERLRVPVALENIAAAFAIPGSEMSEAEFLWALTERTGCGVLLDLTNLLYNSRNQHFNPHVALMQYPLERVWQVHLAGGVFCDGAWVDSHSQPVEAESLALLAKLAGIAPLTCIVVERDDNIPTLSELSGEARRADNCYRAACSSLLQKARS